MDRKYQYVTDGRLPGKERNEAEGYFTSYESYGEDTEEQTEQRYDVLRFTEYGGECSLSVDNVRGELLIYYLSGSPTVDKKTLFLWCRQLGNHLDSCHRCRNGQYFRYLNPYSIVVSEDTLYLLDLEAEENAPVMKMMQLRAVRRHFVNQAVQAGAGGAKEAELYGYGKTIQFLLACAQVTPELTAREERRLANVIAACTGSSKKQYQDITQAVKDIPVLSSRYEALRGNVKLRAGMLGILAAGLILLLAAGAIVLRSGRMEGQQGNMTGAEDSASYQNGSGQSGMNQNGSGQNGIGQNGMDDGDALESQTGESGKGGTASSGDLKRPDELKTPDGADGSGSSALSGSDYLADGMDEGKSSEWSEGSAPLAQVSDLLGAYLKEESSAANARAIVMAHKLELAAVRALVEAYTREGMAEEAAEACGRLIEIEEDKDAAEEAALRKMNLEAELGRLDKAVRTGEDALEQLGESVLIRALTGEYRARLEQGSILKTQ